MSTHAHPTTHRVTLANLSHFARRSAFALVKFSAAVLLTISALLLVLLFLSTSLPLYIFVPVVLANLSLLLLCCVSSEHHWR